MTGLSRVGRRRRLLSTLAVGLTGAALALAPATPAAAAPAPAPDVSSASTRVLPMANPAAPVPVTTVTPAFADKQLTGLVSPKDGTGRLFVIEKSGVVHLYRQSAEARSTYLDLRAVRPGMLTNGERGLLGIALPPNWRSNPYVYLSYVDGAAALRVVRFRPRGGDPDALELDPNSVEDILTVPHPPQATNHYAGNLAFDSRGRLYLSTGDGTTPDVAQNVRSLRGKILRVIPNGPGCAKAYCIPPENPFAGGRYGAPQVWMWGLRNPWRFSINDNGEVWIGDVGQSAVEEVNVVFTSHQGGNFGWSCLEGTRVNDSRQCFSASRIPPYTSYPRTVGRSVTGGLVYHGPDANLQGLYVFGDFASGQLFLVNRATGARTAKGNLVPLVTSFGEGDRRVLYAVTIDGKLLQIGAS